MVRKMTAAAAALLLSTSASASWQRATSRHFIVYSDDTPAHVEAFTVKLEKFDKAMRVWHVAPEDKRGDSARVTVFVVSDIAAIQKLAGRADVAGFYQPRAGESVAFTPRSSGDGADHGFTSQAILFHEYTHHWMLTNDAWSDAAFPPWFVEGFAELHATAIIRNGDVIFGATPTYRGYTVGNMNLLPAAQLLLPNPGHLSGEQRDALYSRGWLLADYLIFNKDRLGQFAAYVTAINSGKSPREANALLGNPNALDFKLNAYGKQSVLPSALIPAKDLTIGKVSVQPLTAAEAAIMPAFILSKRGVTSKAAPGVAAMARRVAASYPDDAFVQNEVAEAEFDVCSTDPTSDAACYVRTEAAADRALATDPKSIHALVYRGMAQAAAAKKNKIVDPAKWSAIRQWFLAANKIDPEAPQPLIDFYESYAAAGQTPTKNAEGAMLYAYALAPYDASVRIKAAHVLLVQDKAAQAKVALGPVAYNLDEPGQADRAQKILAVLDKDGSKAALMEMDKKPEEKDKKG
ncbi:hypothetical protein [uncultured Sphingomonas sp.]|uniref:hypothetical protein n=1 Tax=uncultured Sphingomonas sp. TaxID=158754 RepID=UPI0035CB79C8